jgi:protein phosphatase
MIESMPRTPAAPSTGQPGDAIPGDALVVLVGPAASGKSTWAQARYRPSQILSSDTFRELVADDQSDQAASADAFRVLHIVAGARLARGLRTVIDATNLQRSARAPFRTMAARHGRPCVAVLFDVPLDELIARNAARSRVVPEDVVRRHHDQMAAAMRDIPGEGYRSIVRG